jgi:hypothetical protein
MSEMVSYGANFVKVYDEEADAYLLFCCKEDVILNDRVVEEIKTNAINFVRDRDLDYLYNIYELGWYLHSM